MTLGEVMRDLKSDRVKKVILDTDAYNEIDESHLHPISQVVIERKRSVIPQSSLSIVTLSANHFLSERKTVR